MWEALSLLMEWYWKPDDAHWFKKAANSER